MNAIDRVVRAAERARDILREVEGFPLSRIGLERTKVEVVEAELTEALLDLEAQERLEMSQTGA